MRKRSSRIVAFFMLMVMAVAITINITYADLDLSQSNEDAPSKWAEAEIERAVEINLIPDKIQGEYRNNITREEFSEIAVNLYEALTGKKAVMQGENPFIDTDNVKVGIAKELGIIKGVGDGSFFPNNAITREEISVMLYRTLKTVKPENNYSYSYDYIFADQDKISNWARESVGYLYGIEVINGVGDNMFSPKGNTTREEAIVLAKRIYDKIMVSKGNIIESREGTSRREAVMKSKLEKLLSQEMGKPYQWGGTGPDSYDCSGLVYSLYGKLGISLPRVASDQSKVGIYVPKGELAYGDLVFFAKDGKNVHHVGIYVGDGYMVHAPQTGDVVKKTTITSGYYARTYYTSRRVIN